MTGNEWRHVWLSDSERCCNSSKLASLRIPSNSSEHQRPCIASLEIFIPIVKLYLCQQSFLMMVDIKMKKRNRLCSQEWYKSGICQAAHIWTFFWKATEKVTDFVRNWCIVQRVTTKGLVNARKKLANIAACDTLVSHVYFMHYCDGSRYVYTMSLTVQWMNSILFVAIYFPNKSKFKALVLTFFFLLWPIVMNKKVPEWPQTKQNNRTKTEQKASFI